MRKTLARITLSTLAGGALLAGASVPSRAAEPVKVTVSFRGAHCQECVTALRAAVAKVPRVKVAGSIETGDSRRHFSPPVVLELADVVTSDIGAVARAAAEAKTPHRATVVPGANLVLFTQPGSVSEETVIALRAAVTGVLGINTTAVGAIGGIPDEATFWVMLDRQGEATLSDVKRALNAAVFQAEYLKP